MSERDSLIPDVDDVERASRRASSSSRAASRAVAGSSAEGVGRHVVFNMRVASALFFAGTTLLAMGAIVGRSADAARASALGEGAGGTCALSPTGAGANAAANTCAARYMDELGLWDAADAGDNVEFETKVYECMNEPTGAPVVVPRNGVAKPFATKPGSAYAWIFVHIPKAAGSVFIEMLKQNKNHETVVLHEPAHPDFLVNPWRPLNSLQARHVPTMLRTFKQNRESKSGTFSKEFMHADYDEGRRMYFTGATGIGMCGTVDAPCAYITVLREPMSRLWSEYTYLCLEANEGHLSWTAEEIAADNHQGCPLNPLEWYNQKRSTAAQLTGLLGARGGHTPCGAEAAKANLASSCVRYIFQDDIENGMKRIREKLPDLAHLGDDGGNKQYISGALLEHHNGSAEKLAPALAARLDAYKADPTIVAGLRALVEHDISVYEFAKAKYDEHWSAPLVSC